MARRYALEAGKLLGREPMTLLLRAQAAQLALERASSALADSLRSVATTVDEVQMANRTFHRARLTNLSQDQAIDGCKRLEKRKIYCSALQVTAWNTTGAR